MKTSQLWTVAITTSDKYHPLSPARNSPIWFFPSLENSLGYKPQGVQNQSLHSLPHKPEYNSNEQFICHYKMHYTYHSPSNLYSRKKCFCLIKELFLTWIHQCFMLHVTIPLNKTISKLRKISLSDVYSLEKWLQLLNSFQVMHTAIV